MTLRPCYDGSYPRLANSRVVLQQVYNLWDFTIGHIRVVTIITNGCR
jgi:hypothetical protein